MFHSNNQSAAAQGPLRHRLLEFALLPEPLPRLVDLGFGLSFARILQVFLEAGHPGRHLQLVGFLSGFPVSLPLTRWLLQGRGLRRQQLLLLVVAVQTELHRSFEPLVSITGSAEFECVLIRLGLQIFNRQRAVEARRGRSLCLELLLALGSVVLVHLVLDLPHALCFFNAKHLALLVPAPLVHLALSQACPPAHELKRLLGPVGVRVELFVQAAELFAGFSLASADYPIQAARLRIVEVSPSLVSDDLLFTRACRAHDLLLDFRG